MGPICLIFKSIGLPYPWPKSKMLGLLNIFVVGLLNFDWDHLSLHDRQVMFCNIDRQPLPDSRSNPNSARSWLAIRIIHQQFNFLHCLWCCQNLWIYVINSYFEQVVMTAQNKHTVINSTTLRWCLMLFICFYLSCRPLFYNFSVFSYLKIETHISVITISYSQSKLRFLLTIESVLTKNGGTHFAHHAHSLRTLLCRSRQFFGDAKYICLKAFNVGNFPHTNFFTYLLL